MALPHLVKHIYNHATDEVIRRGKKIYATGNAELVEYDDLLSTVAFRIKDDSYATFYRVHILNYKDPKTLSLRCTCPYNLSEICRHKAASLFALQEMLDKNQLGEREIVYDQKHTIVKMKLLDLKMIKLLSSAENYSLADTYLNKQKAIILEAKDERVKAEVKVDGQKFKLLLKKKEKRNF